jgi:hypothetical protein
MDAERETLAVDASIDSNLASIIGSAGSGDSEPESGVGCK